MATAQDRNSRNPLSALRRSGRRQTRVALILLAAVAMMWALTAYSYFRNAQESIRQLGTEDLQWVGHQNSYEYYGLMLALNQALAAPDQIDAAARSAMRENVKSHADRMWSRINALKRGPTADILRDAEAMQNALAHIEEILDANETLLYGLDLTRDREIRALIADLSAVNDDVVAGRLSMLSLTARLRAEAVARVRRGRNMIGLATAAAFIAAGFIVFLIVREARRARSMAAKNLQLARVAEAGRRAKAEFLTTTSHEIRTPLNGILGMLAAMEDSGLRRDQAIYARIARSSASSLLALLSQILDDARLEENRLTLNESPDDPRRVIDDAVSITAPQAWDKCLELSVYVAGNIPQRLMIDAPRLRQIVLNFISNAVKFTDDGGVMVRMFRIPDYKGEPFYRIEVSDSGPGMSDIDKAHIFERFRQAGDSSRSSGGSGLGLSIAQRLAHAFGGSVGVCDRDGGGSVFWFQGPLRAAEPGRADFAAPAQIKILDGKTILYFNQAETPTAAHEALAGCGARVIRVHDRAELDARIDQNRPDGVILCGPSMVAFDLAEILLAQNCAARLLVTRLDAPDPVREDRLITAGVGVIGAPLGPFGLRFLAGGPIVEDATATQTPSKLLHGLRVLAAEDQPINQMVLSMHLSKLGAEAEIVDDCAAAVERAQEHLYDVIILDLHTPRMSGAEATVEIRCGKGANRSTPIVALTADATASAQTMLTEAGVDVFATKPVSREELAGAILSVCTPNHEYQDWEDPQGGAAAAASANSAALEPQELQNDLEGDAFADRAAQELQALATRLAAAADARAARFVAHEAVGALAVLGLAEEAELARMVEDAAAAEEDDWAETAADLADVLQEASGRQGLTPM